MAKISTLPIVSKETIEEWRGCRENVRDLRERISAIEKKNPELVRAMYVAEAATNRDDPNQWQIPWREDFSYNLGFLRCYEILRRQIEKDENSSRYSKEA